MYLGSKIYFYRNKLGLSQEDLAELLDVSRVTIYKWENDYALPNLNNIIKLSEVFGINVDQLLNSNIK